MSQGPSFGTSGGAAREGTPAKDMRFVVKSLLSNVRTSEPVEVMAVTNAGGVEPIGYVDIRPLVSQLDGSGNVVSHGTVYNVPYLRIQGGRNAVILDPQVGDIGIASFCHRDISAVKAAKKASPPGSQRRHDMSDAIYLHSIIGPAPEQYIEFYDGGIHVHSPTKIRFTAPEIELEATTSIKHNAPTIQSDADTITSTATASITDNAPIATTNAPAIGLNGAIVQTAGTAGTGSVQMVGPLHVIEEITSDTDVISAGKSGAHHTHYENGEGNHTDEPS